MEKELHILILEDLPSDAELAQKELKRVLKNYMVKVVDTEKGFVQALATFKPDLIISDYLLPSFDGLSALKITQDKSPFTPFIILTGSMNEDTAVECIKAGADDYVIKEHIKRLGPAVLNAMENKKIELERKQAEEKLKDSEEYLKILFDYAPDAYYISDLKGNFIDGNKAAEKVIGYKREELIGKSLLKLKLLSLADTAKAAKLLVKNLRGQPTGPDEIVLNRKDNSKVIVEISTHPVKIKGRTLVLGIARDITERKQAEERLKKTMDATIQTVSKIIEAKDPYTSGHQQRVCQLTVPLAQELGLSQDKVEGIRIASLIHDIGKIGIPTEILSKPTSLTNKEFNLIKVHSQKGYDILKPIDFSYPIAQIVLQHHEKINGSGYPNNLKGDEILLEAKIIGVADVMEAMSSFRPYRPALGIDAALEEITQKKGILYDPEVANACLKLFKEKGFKFK